MLVAQNQQSLVIDLTELALVRNKNVNVKFEITNSLGVPIGVLHTERIVATVYCSGDSVVELLTVSPLFVNKTSLALVPGTTNQWYITLSWVPKQDQKGPQVIALLISLLFLFQA